MDGPFYSPTAADNTEMDGIAVNANMDTGRYHDNLQFLGAAMSELAAYTMPVKGRQAAPPSSPSAGDLYIVAPSATGDWTGQSEQFAVYVGAPTNAWRFVTPQNPHYALLNDGGFASVVWFNGTVWAAQNTVLQFQQRTASGTDGGATVAGVNKRVLNTQIQNHIVGASVDTSTGIVTLPAGRYEVWYMSVAFYANGFQSTLRVWDAGEANLALHTALALGSSGYSPRNSGADNGASVGSCELLLTAETQIYLATSCQLGWTIGQGAAANGTEQNVFADLKITRKGSL